MSPSFNGSVHSIGPSCVWVPCKAHDFSDWPRPTLNFGGSIAGELKASHPELEAKSIDLAISGYPVVSIVGVSVFVPELMSNLHHLCWDGDGHFDRSKFVEKTPPGLGDIITYVRMVERSLLDGHAVIQFSSRKFKAQNAILAGAVMILLHKASARGAWATISRACASSGENEAAWERFPLPFSMQGTTGNTSVTVLDCLEGLESALNLGWLNYRTFDVKAWFELRRKFDATWLIPDAMLAIGDPASTSLNPAYPNLLTPSNDKKMTMEFEDALKTDTYPAERMDTPSTDATIQELRAELLLRTSSALLVEKTNFPDMLSAAGVTHVVRLNYSKETAACGSYEQVFNDAGFEINAFAFKDGTAPPAQLAKQFIREATKWRCGKEAKSVVAVHCKAGLGRTGAIIALYACHNYEIDGKAFHGWARMCRPGCIQTVEQEAWVRALPPASKRQMPGCFGSLGRILSI